MSDDNNEPIQTPAPKPQLPAEPTDRNIKGGTGDHPIAPTTSNTPNKPKI